MPISTLSHLSTTYLATLFPFPCLSTILTRKYVSSLSPSAMRLSLMYLAIIKTNIRSDVDNNRLFVFFIISALTLQDVPWHSESIVSLMLLASSHLLLWLLSLMPVSFNQSLVSLNILFCYTFNFFDLF